MANKHLKRCLTSLAMVLTQVKITKRYHFTLTKMPIIKMTTKCWWGSEETEPHIPSGRQEEGIRMGYLMPTVIVSR